MRIRACGLLRLRLPFRFAFKHSSAERRFTDNLIVRLVLDDGTEGYGEGVPRDYVTGETIESAARAAAGIYLPDLRKLDPVSFGEAAWAAAGLGVVRDGEVVYNSARCAVELALIDAYAKAFGVGPETLRSFFPGTDGRSGSRDALKTAVLPFLRGVGSRAAFRFFRLCGFRSFKLKLGGADDAPSWKTAAWLSKRARHGRIALCADANGAWSTGDAPGLMDRLAKMGYGSVEQPVPRAELGTLALVRGEAAKIGIVADESIRTAGEAERLAAGRACDAVLVRLSKCGGLFPSLQVVEIARHHGLECRLGAMVGETGLLAAAQGLFLDIAPGLASVEPSLSRLLLRRNIARRPSLAGGLTGLWPSRGSGLGVVVDTKTLNAFSETLFEETWRGSRGAG